MGSGDRVFRGLVLGLIAILLSGFGAGCCRSIEPGPSGQARFLFTSVTHLNRLTWCS